LAQVWLKHFLDNFSFVKVRQLLFKSNHA